MNHPEYDDWRVHGNRHKCGVCGDVYYDVDGGCGKCADREDEKLENLSGCYFCGREFPDRDCIPADDYNDNDGGSICPICVDERSDGRAI